MGDSMTTTTWMRWTPLCVAALAWAAACSAPTPNDEDDEGAGGAGGAGEGGMTATTTTTTTTTTGSGTCATANLTFNAPACAACAEGSCCSSLQACDGSADCVSYLGCLQACSDQACADTCATMHAEGKPLLDALDACLDTSCAADCGGAADDFPICDSGLSVSDEACATCLGDTCCEDVVACEAEADCMSCVTGSAAACDTSSLDDAVRDCWNVDCMTACGRAGF